MAKWRPVKSGTFAAVTAYFEALQDRPPLDDVKVQIVKPFRIGKRAAIKAWIETGSISKPPKQ